MIGATGPVSTALGPGRYLGWFFFGQEEGAKRGSRLGSGRPGIRACGLREGLAGAFMEVKV